MIDPQMTYRNWLHQLAVVSLLAVPAISLHNTRAAPRTPGLVLVRHQPYMWHSNANAICRSTTTTPEAKWNVGGIRSMHQTPIKFKFPIYSANAGDFDAFMDELDIDTNLVEAIKKKEPSHFIQGKADVGIGGNSGFTYDVNALKRNLVQESVRGCKQELLVLLGDGRQYSDGVLAPRWRRDRDDLIEERLSALVQVCPIYAFATEDYHFSRLSFCSSPKLLP